MNDNMEGFGVVSSKDNSKINRFFWMEEEFGLKLFNVLTSDVDFEHSFFNPFSLFEYRDIIQTIIVSLLPILYPKELKKIKKKYSSLFFGIKTFGGLSTDKACCLCTIIQNYLCQQNVKVLTIDCNNESFNSKMYIFNIFNIAKDYDVLIATNMDVALYSFFINYGITKIIDVGFVFFSESISEIEECLKITQGPDGTEYIEMDDLAYLKTNKVGFELYDSLREWKSESVFTRNDPEYRKMKKRVRQRDNNTCQCCGYYSNKKTHHNLEVHHIYGYKDHLDYRAEDSNCVVLCKDCHKQYHSIYGKKNVNPVSFAHFIRDYNNFHNKERQATLNEVDNGADS